MLGGAYWTQRSVLTVDGLSTPAGLRAVSQLVLSVTWSLNDIPSTFQLNLCLNYWCFCRKYCRMPKQALLKSFVIIVWRSLNPWTVEKVYHTGFAAIFLDSSLKFYVSKYCKIGHKQPFLETTNIYNLYNGLYP